jgi:pimeloyl-ACP methyl ester carboxylesterase
MPRILKIGIVAVAVVVLVVFGVLFGGAWYISDILKTDALVIDRSEGAFDLRVAAVSDGRVTLAATSDTNLDGEWKRDGTWGLAWETGYAQVGAVISAEAQEVVRDISVLDGTPEVGTPAKVEGFAYPSDPLTAHGLAFEEVRYTSPIGELDAWLVEGTRPTWAIFVHGKGSNRREALRMLPAVVAEGFPSLVITYRNDEGMPLSEDGYYNYGTTEWEDLDGAAEYALSHGAEGLVLVGYSMGGAIAISFQYESSLADRVRGVIMDAPMIDFGKTVELGAREQNLPSFMVGLAKWLGSVRFGMDWDAMDYQTRIDQLKAPILLFHGDADRKVPVSSSDALAETRPDIVTYVRVADSEHVRAWNTDRQAYEGAVRTFLRGLDGG